MDNELLVKSIRETCKENNITPSQLENELGFGAGLISRWSKSSPSLDKIIDIADYFKISIDELIGRNISSQFYFDQEDNFISTLMELTKNKTLIWKQDKFYENKEINGESYDDVFGIYLDYVEFYQTKFNDSTIFLISQYRKDYGITDDLDILLFIQPDEISTPVLQNYSKKSLENIWLEIRKEFNGIPDEWKAEDIKKQIINKGVENILSTTDDVVLKEANTPEFKRLLSVFSDPKMMEAMRAAQNVINYLNKTDNESDKEIQDGMKEVLLIKGNVLYDVKSRQVIDNDKAWISSPATCKSFYKKNKTKLGTPSLVIGKRSLYLYLITDTMIMKLVGLYFGKNWKTDNGEALKYLLEECGFDTPDDKILRQENFEITK